MKKIVFAAMLFIMAGLVQALGAQTVPGEVTYLQDEFGRQVRARQVDPTYLDGVRTDMIKYIRSLGEEFERSQYFLYVDRNQSRQMLFVCYFDAATQDIIVLGTDLVSTGNPERMGFFATPIGIYKSTSDIAGYRSLGTPNDKGWRGYGRKGMRIWDFGWHRGHNEHNGYYVDVRILMHATDPDFGEERLGTRDSKGCIRISHKLNRFLDHYGILDRELESKSNSPKIKWLLAQDREPAAYAGKYLFVGDSGRY